MTKRFTTRIFHQEAARKSITGIQAKRIGDRIRTNPSWHQRKLDVMETIIGAKLRICHDAWKVLVESGDRQIVEDTVHEFWGHGKDGKGQNM